MNILTINQTKDTSYKVKINGRYQQGILYTEHFMSTFHGEQLIFINSRGKRIYLSQTFDVIGTVGIDKMVNDAVKQYSIIEVRS